MYLINLLFLLLSCVCKCVDTEQTSDVQAIGAPPTPTCMFLANSSHMFNYFDVLLHYIRHTNTTFSLWELYHSVRTSCYALTSLGFTSRVVILKMLKYDVFSVVFQSDYYFICFP